MNEAPIADEPLDIQHDTDPAHEEPPARRIPHLGHTFLFFSLNLFCIGTCAVISLWAVHASSSASMDQHPLAAFFGQVLGYLVAFAIALLVFPLFWQHSFINGIHFNLRAARLNWWKLILIGVLTQVIATLALNLLKPPDHNEIMQLFSTPLSAWITFSLVAFVPPVAEEVAFRGFLLPSLATAYDWLSFERTPAGVARWQQTASHTRMAWAFATVFTSLAFAALHGPDYGWSAGALVVLFVASVVFSLVRIKTRSVAASALVHIAYNGLLLVGAIVETGGFRHLDKLK